MHAERLRKMTKNLRNKELIQILTESADALDVAAIAVAAAHAERDGATAQRDGATADANAATVYAAHVSSERTVDKEVIDRLHGHIRYLTDRIGVYRDRCDLAVGERDRATADATAAAAGATAVNGELAQIKACRDMDSAAIGTLRAELAVAIDERRALEIENAQLKSIHGMIYDLIVSVRTN